MEKTEIKNEFYKYMRKHQSPITGEEEAAKLLVELMTDFVNGCGNNGMDAFAQHLMCEHRTLQQSTFSLFMHCVNAWAEKNKTKEYDGRNEYTVKLCSEIAKLFKSTRAPII